LGEFKWNKKSWAEKELVAFLNLLNIFAALFYSNILVLRLKNKIYNQEG
jgi:hypothetical protein